MPTPPDPSPEETARKQREEANKFEPPKQSDFRRTANWLGGQISDKLVQPLGGLASYLSRPPQQNPEAGHWTQQRLKLTEDRELAARFYRSAMAKMPEMLDEQTPLINDSLNELKSNQISQATNIDPETSSPAQQEALTQLHTKLGGAVSTHLANDTLVQPQANFSTQILGTQASLKTALATPEATGDQSVSSQRDAANLMADRLGEKKKALLIQQAGRMFGVSGNANDVDLTQFQKNHPDEYHLFEKAGIIDASDPNESVKRVKARYEQHCQAINDVVNAEVAIVKTRIKDATTAEHCDHLFDPLKHSPRLATGDFNTADQQQAMANFNANLQGACQYALDNTTLQDGRTNITLDQQVTDIQDYYLASVKQLQQRLSQKHTFPASMDYIHARLHQLRENMEAATQTYGKEKVTLLDTATRETFGIGDDGKMINYQDYKTSDTHEAIENAGLLADCADDAARQAKIEAWCEAQCKENSKTVESQVKATNQQLKDTELASHTLFDRLARDMAMLRAKFKNDEAMYAFLQKKQCGIDPAADDTTKGGTDMANTDRPIHAYDFTKGLKIKLAQENQKFDQNLFGYRSSVHGGDGGYSMKIHQGSTNKDILANVSHQLDMYIADQPKTKGPVGITMTSEFHDAESQPDNARAFNLATIQAQAILNEDMLDVKPNEYYEKDYNRDDDPIKFDVQLKNDSGRPEIKRFTMADFKPPKGEAFLRAGSPEYNQHNNTLPPAQHRYTEAQTRLLKAWEDRQKRLEIRSRLRDDTSEAKGQKAQLLQQDMRQQYESLRSRKSVETYSPMHGGPRPTG